MGIALATDFDYPRIDLTGMLNMLFETPVCLTINLPCDFIMPNKASFKWRNRFSITPAAG